MDPARSSFSWSRTRQAEQRCYAAVRADTPASTKASGGKELGAADAHRAMRSRKPTITAPAPLDPVHVWRFERLLAAGLSPDLASRVSADSGYDLHALLELIDRGCPAELAPRILAPLDSPEPC
jgi:hypothetical protein